MRHWLANKILALFGWRAVGSLADHPKCVIVVAPHTSNWDFPVLMLVKIALRLQANWIGKHTLFRPPFGWIMRWLGGLPIDRSARHNMVEQAVESFRTHDRLMLVITPEGTRKRAPYWRSGFYHVAQGAHVPIALAFADYRRKVGGIGGVIMPSGDIDADMALIRDFYIGIVGKNPEQFGEIRLKAQDDTPAAQYISSQRMSFFRPAGRKNDIHKNKGDIPMRQLGLIKHVQLQRSSLKQGQKPHRYYDPAPLLVVECLRLDAGGTSAVDADGAPIIDIHHASHPETKQQLGKNGISISFTGHYRAMRDRYGAHLADGIAGENILVESDRVWSLADLGAAVLIECANGRLVTLDGLVVAAPCVEFSHFAHLSADSLTADQLRTTLQFLDGGMRGFYARLADGQDDVEIRAGDRVFVS